MDGNAQKVRWSMDEVMEYREGLRYLNLADSGVFFGSPGLDAPLGKLK
jgi:hypothetical protein